MDHKQKGNSLHLPRKGTKQLTFTTTGDENHSVVPCDDCNQKHCIVEANAYCPFCKRYLCLDCQHEHQIATQTAAHVVLIGKEMPKSTKGFQTSRIDVCVCKDHSYRMIEFFCPKHNNVFCTECKTSKHIWCANVALVRKVAKGIKSGRELPTVLQNVRDTMVQFERLRTIKVSQQERVEEQMNRCIKDVKTFREKQTDILEKLEKDMKDTIEKIFEKEIATLNEQRQKCDSNVTALQKEVKNLDAFKSLEEINCFAAMLKSKQTLRDSETDLNSLSSYKHELKFTFEHNRKLLYTIRESDVIGTIKTTFMRPKSADRQTPSISSERSSVDSKSSLKTNPIPLKTNPVPNLCKENNFIMCGEHKINSEEDIKRTCMITGSLFLPDGRLVLCDNRNNKLKLFDIIIQLKFILELNGSPYDLTGVKNKELAITVPEKKELHFVKVDPNLRVTRVVKTETGCHGICYHRDGLLTTCYSHGMFGMVLMMDTDGKVLQRFDKDVRGNTIFQGPFYIAVDYVKDRFYVTDKAANSVVGLTLGGKVLFRYYSKDLASPGAITLDKDGTVYACGRDSKTIHVLKSNGKKMRILEFEDGFEISSIGYRTTDGLFILAPPRTDTIRSYKLI